MAAAKTQDHRICLIADIEAYGFPVETAKALQHAALGVLRDAAASVGINSESWYRQAAGDGLLAVLPEDVDGRLSRQA